MGASDYLPITIWVKMFLEAQGREMKENVHEQDNESAIKLKKKEECPQASSPNTSTYVSTSGLRIVQQAKKNHDHTLSYPTDVRRRLLYKAITRDTQPEVQRRYPTPTSTPSPWWTLCTQPRSVLDVRGPRGMGPPLWVPTAVSKGLIPAVKKKQNESACAMTRLDAKDAPDRRSDTEGRQPQKLDLRGLTWDVERQ